MKKIPQLALAAELGERTFPLEGGARQVLVTPDGKRIVSIGNGVHVWDVETGGFVMEIETPVDGEYVLAISNDGARILVGGSNLVHVCTLGDKPKVIAKPALNKTGIVQAAAFSPDGGFVFGDRRAPRRFDAKGKELAALGAHSSDVDAIAVSPDGTRIVTCGGKTTKLHAVDGKKPTVIRTWEDLAKSCGFSPDGKHVWTSSFAATRMRDVATGKMIWESDRIVDVRAVTADGARYASRSDGNVTICTPAKKTPLATIRFVASGCAFTPDGTRLVVASENLGVAVFEVESGRRLLPSATGTSGAIETLAVAANLPHAVYSAGADGSVMLWDVEVGAPIERVVTVEGAVSQLACSADGNTVIAASTSAKLAAWDVRAASGKPFAASGNCQSVVLSPNGKRVAAIVYVPRAVEICELATRKCIAHQRDGRSFQYGDVAFVDDDTVAAITTDGSVQAVRVKAKKPVYELATESATALCVVGATLVVGCSAARRGCIELYDASTGEPRAELRKSGGGVDQLRAIDDDLVAVLEHSGNPRTTAVEVWSLAKKRAVTRAAFDGESTALAVSPDGTRIYVGTKAGRLLVFHR